jgi:serine protease Do
MKNTAALLLSILLGSTTAISAQTNLSPDKKSKHQENIVMESTINGKTTKIELKNGEMYVDGKKMEGDEFTKNLNTIRKIGKGMRNGSIDGAQIDIDLPEKEEETENVAGDQEATNRPMLGVSSKPTPDNIGAEITNVPDNTPADIAGIKPGDIITSLGNVVVNTPEDLANAVARFKVNENVEIKYLRDGKEKKTYAELTEKNDRGANSFGGNRNPFGNDNPFEGLMKMFDGNDMNFGRSARIPKTNNIKLGIVAEERADNDGVRVAEITEDGIAKKAGIQLEDVITTFGGKAIKSIEDLGDAIEAVQKQKDVVVNVKRGRELKTLYIELPVQLRKQDF